MSRKFAKRYDLYRAWTSITTLHVWAKNANTRQRILIRLLPDKDIIHSIILSSRIGTTHAGSNLSVRATCLFIYHHLRWTRTSLAKQGKQFIYLFLLYPFSIYLRCFLESLAPLGNRFFLSASRLRVVTSHSLILAQANQHKPTNLEQSEIW